ncbi:MAG: hypothetical protein WEB06_10810 [Actinomycetota bacterium]
MADAPLLIRKPQPADPYMDAWQRLIESDGVGPSRLHAVILLEPECGDEQCFYYDPAAGACRLLEAGIPWSRGTCRMRTTHTERRS